MQSGSNSDLTGRGKTLTALLFVGGLSRRMGRDKAELQLAGEALWARQLRLLRGLKPNALWISARTRPEWCPPEIEVVIDDPPSRGPLSGLAAALQKLKTSHLLAMAVDLPRMTVEPLDKLWQLAEVGSGVIPAHGDVLEPLCAIYPAEAASNAAVALRERDDVSLRSFVQTLHYKNQVRIYPLIEPERRCFYNMNTPDELKACLSTVS